MVIVDVVTSRVANLHYALLDRLGVSYTPNEMNVYATAYRLIERNDEPEMDIWAEQLAVGQTLVSLPLWLSGDLCLQADLETTYERTRREQLSSDEDAEAG